MSLIDTARDALKDLPISDIVRERLSLALDRLTEAEAKIEELQAAKGRCQAELERERFDHQRTRGELERLRNEPTEEIRIHRFIEFRRGKRTGGKWAAFCPRCHMPVGNLEGNLVVTCSDHACKWHITLPNMPLSHAVAELDP